MRSHLSVPAAVERIRERDPIVRAFLRTRFDAALEEHAARIAESPRSRLHGLPYGLKDMWDTAGIVTTGGSWRYRDRVPAESSPIHRLFDDAGAVLMGKTSLSDLAIVPEASNYFVGRTCNPHDLTRTSGGSSGGAATGVAERMIAFDWGSDFGGSIRLPAAYCGVYGLRLSTEAWPVRGLFPSLPASLAWMNGQGPIAPDLETLRALLDVAAPLRTGTTRPFELRGVAIYSPRGGATGEWPQFADEVAAVCRRAFEAVDTRPDVPPVNEARFIAPAFVASHFDDMMGADEISFGEGLRAIVSALALRGRFGDRRFHPDTAAMLLMIAIGHYVVFRDRKKAVANARALGDSFRAVWDQGWALAMPTSTFPAPRHGGSLTNQYVMAYTMLGNVTDSTALAIPFGRFAGGLPRSLQLLGPPGSERALIDAAERIERAV